MDLQPHPRPQIVQLLRPRRQRCVEELRSKGVSETCPLCRAPLPPGPEKLFELGWRVWLKMRKALGLPPWPPLSASQQKEMDGAIVMFQEAMDQVSGRG